MFTIFKQVVYGTLMLLIIVLFIPVVIVAITFTEVIKSRLKSDLDAMLTALILFATIILTQWMWFEFLYKLFLGTYSLYY